MLEEPDRTAFLPFIRRARLFAARCLILMAPLACCHAQKPQPWPLWQAYTKAFLDEGGRVIDRSAHDRTTSEGQAYALFFALVGNDKPHFEKILAWTEANLAAGDLTQRLPAWNWGKSPSGDWKPLDTNSASDADLWIAYTLLEAGRLWHNPRYATLGRLVAARIAHEEVVMVPGLGATLAPGPHGFHPDPDTYILNPSYLPLPVLAYFAKTIPDGPWAAVLASLPHLLGAQLGHGYAMDWLSAGSAGIAVIAPPAQASAGAREPQPSGSYDAIRVYLWLGIADPATPGRAELLAHLPAMAAYLSTALIPPLEVDAAGSVLHTNSPVGFSAAVYPYLTALGLKSQARLQLDRITATEDPATGLYGKPGEYYDQNLVLFSTGWSSARYRFDSLGKLRIKSK